MNHLDQSAFAGRGAAAAHHSLTPGDKSLAWDSHWKCAAQVSTHSEATCAGAVQLCGIAVAAGINTVGTRNVAGES